jgi:hypothetical protein
VNGSIAYTLKVRQSEGLPAGHDNLAVHLSWLAVAVATAIYFLPHLVQLCVQSNFGTSQLSIDLYIMSKFGEFTVLSCFSSFNIRAAPQMEARSFYRNFYCGGHLRRQKTDDVFFVINPKFFSRVIKFLLASHFFFLARTSPIIFSQSRYRRWATTTNCWEGVNGYHLGSRAPRFVC